jgi:hypothetical protein
MRGVKKNEATQKKLVKHGRRLRRTLGRRE